MTNNSNGDALQQFILSLRDYVDSGASLIHVRTGEMERTVSAIISSVLKDKDSVEMWNHAEGFVTPTALNYKDIIHSPQPVDREPTTAIRRPYEYLKYIESAINVKDVGKEPPYINATVEPEAHYMLFVGLTADLFKVPFVKALMHTYAARLPSTPIRIILVTEDFSLAEETPDSLVSLRMAPPSIKELEHIYLNICVEDLGSSVSFDVEALKEAAHLASAMGSGMGKTQFENAVSLAIIKADRETTEDGGSSEDFVDRVITYIADGKKEVINNSDLLTLMSRDEDMSSIGGMNNLKDWIEKRAACYSDEAIEFGARPPKGAVLVGVAGCGKSLVGKAIGSVLGVPVVKLDIGSMFNSYVGASEDRIRRALAMAESLAPCVLFIDEIDKGLGGAGGGGDSGVSSRVLGTILTWLQDNRKPVFTLVTANNISHLPPELLRRGRFDAIFSCVLPNDDERWEVLKIHLEKRGRHIEDVAEEGSDEHLAFIQNSANYVPAEIESAVEDAIVEAFSDEDADDITMDHIVDALNAMVPMAESYKDKVDEIIAWSKDNATPVSTIAKKRLAKNNKTPRSRTRIRKNQ